MNPMEKSYPNTPVLVPGRSPESKLPSLSGIAGQLDMHAPAKGGWIHSLPFALHDTTAGSESELQAIVKGRRMDVDLPITIEQSNYFANIIKWITSGEAPRKAVTDLERWLAGNVEGVWENSWVRFPARLLDPYAKRILDLDLLADKSSPQNGLRSDAVRFIFHQRGEETIRVPVSYLLKLSLADVLGGERALPAAIRQTGENLMNHFLSDNSSPETFSFYVVPLRPESGMGQALARETARRFLLTQLLMLHANEVFQLRATGQEAMIYSAPHPPVRQKELNDCISDAYYRELFMSPCLSGWCKGEEKHQYMGLCHEVLSRSQLNGVAKLREAGIINRNLVVLPNTSNISLANNGTHVSLGSRKLTGCLKDSSSGFTRVEEKYLGDLVIKFTEHFLPLFAGTYSAAPYRVDFWDFHPEKLLGFLPHELDYTHLRMIWRRWRKKASTKVFGHPITPFGPRWFDRILSALFGLKGDFLPDFRLVDYFVALMSTERSPALDGQVGNGERLKQDLAHLGVFNCKMALYQLVRLREYHVMGFSGFEMRIHSLFESHSGDMGPAVDLQLLVTALAFKYIAQGKLEHGDIPDQAFVESERRQIFFGAAIGIPTFYVSMKSRNALLKRILRETFHVRASRRYPGYWRVYSLEYRKALLRILRQEAADLVEMLDLEDILQDLQLRLDDPERHSAAGKITRGILGDLDSREALRMKGREFNQEAERCYRNDLRIRQTREALDSLEADLENSEGAFFLRGSVLPKELFHVVGCEDPLRFLRMVKQDVLEGTITPDELRELIHLVLTCIHCDIQGAKAALNESSGDHGHEAPIHRAANG